MAEKLKTFSLLFSVIGFTSLLVQDTPKWNWWIIGSLSICFSCILAIIAKFHKKGGDSIG
jgi:hypothetical protein